LKVLNVRLNEKFPRQESKKKLERMLSRRKKKHGRKLWRTRRSFGKTQQDGEAWLLDNFT